MSREARAAIGAGALVLAAALFILLRPDDDASAPERSATAPGRSQEPRSERPRTRPSAPRPKRIRVAGGRPVDGVGQISYEKGERVRLTVSSSDTTGHVHVHGYDLLADLRPGRAARFSFEASLEGVFEIELEDTRTLLAELRVTP